MTIMLVALSLFADPIQELQGTWTSDAGTVIVIDDDQAFIGKGQEAEFRGQVRVPKQGTLQIVVGAEVAIEMAYKLAADKLTLTIDGNAIEYTRKPVRGRG